MMKQLFPLHNQSIRAYLVLDSGSLSFLLLLSTDIEQISLI